MTEPATPIVVTPSTNAAAAGTFLKDLAVILAAFPILIQLVGKRDLGGFLAWLQSSDGALVVSIVLPIVVSGWRAWRSKKRKAELVTIASDASDKIAIVQEKPTPAA